ncbi:glycosyltransferase [Bacteroides graminisolvens]|uniref:glycosyltransferase n=1 Tax=Bacteroides graminisolvens TaxID=477666 RepID=UPI0029C97FAB|nr:glycosyltransferase [Bacteroides graminisolvens]
MKRKLLIISHNIIDNSNNVGKTVISLLKQWPQEDIYSIYFRNEIRSTMLCDHSYMISDRDVLGALSPLNKNKCGRTVDADRNAKDVVSDASAYRMGNKRYPIISMVRDVLWHTRKWKTNALKEWVENINPDVILFIPNDYVLAFEIADYVYSLVNAKMYTFFTDDSFYYKQNTGLIDTLRRNWIKKIGKDIIDESTGMITASHLMQSEYKELFGKDSIVLGNCVEISNISNQIRQSSDGDYIFSYIGNLHSNRWRCLLDIAKAIENISSSFQKNIIIKVYTASDLPKSVLRQLKSQKCMQFMGCIPACEVKKAQEESDALIHIEAFDYKSKVSTRLSMSTKIFEYMSRNVPIFAYGPNDISSMSFLALGPFAKTCSDPSELTLKLKEFLSFDKERTQIRDKAYLYAKENFIEEKISQLFFDFLNKTA